LDQTVELPLSWYERTVRRESHSALRAKTDADVCVVGGGLAGLTTALELASLGKSVVLLEAQRLAFGASGRNAGFVSNGFALGVEGIAARVGLEEAKLLYDLSRRGAAYVRAQIAKHEPSIEMGKGLRISARYQDGGELARHGKFLRENFEENVSALTVEETRLYLTGTRYFESLFFHDAFHIHPLRYALLLARLCQKAGVAIHETSAARQVEKTAAGFVVKTDSGEVRAGHVVHCVSALDRQLHRPSGRAILPVATHIAVTEALEQSVISTAAAVADTRRAGDYYRIIDQGRILWGGRITTWPTEPKMLAEVMRRDMLECFPELGTPRIEYAWSGIMGYARHKMPLIGRDQEGQWFATGFGGHGLNTTAMAGILIANAIAVGNDAYKRFAAFPPKWNFGPLGRVGVQSAYWGMQFRDALDESFRT
jgi:gamma-glutamylputrescine oxidase